MSENTRLTRLFVALGLALAGGAGVLVLAFFSNRAALGLLAAVIIILSLMLALLSRGSVSQLLLWLTWLTVIVLVSFLTFLTGGRLSPFIYFLFYVTAVAALSSLNMKYLITAILVIIAADATATLPVEQLGTAGLPARILVYLAIAAAVRVTIDYMGKINVDLWDASAEISEREKDMIFMLEEEEASHEKQNRLNMVIKEIAGIDDADTMTHVAIERAVNLIEGEIGAIAYWSSDDQRVAVKAGYNWPDDALLSPLNEPEMLEQVKNKSTFAEYPDSLIKLPPEMEGQYGQVVATPISHGADFLGVIIIIGAKGQRLSLDYKEMIAILAGVMSPAIANSNLFSQLAKVVNQMIVVNEVSQNLSSYLDLNELLNQIVGKVNQLMGTNAAFVHVWDETKRRFNVGASVGFTSPSPILRSVAYGEGLIGWIAKNNQMVEVADIKESPHLSEVGSDQNFTFLFAIPIIAHDRVIGIIGCLADRPNRPDEGDISLLLSLANTTAVSIENAWLYEQTQELARVDGLTGLFNYRELQRILDEEIERANRYKNSFALLMMDVDNFKDYNDHNGHDIGDDALRMISEIIGKSCRRLDKGFRYGGEEFCLLLLDTSRETASVIAERVRQEIESAVFLGQESQPSGSLTISIGIAIFPDDSADKRALTSHADQALYQAKDMGRNKVRAYRKDVAA